ncbi:MAG TPA: hypothetical protein DDX37_01935 [Candidatus Omnitrophica bacterium]|nr:hypothetical protein [Candidatus Omnitrophota bacterium]
MLLLSYLVIIVLLGVSAAIMVLGASESRTSRIQRLSSIAFSIAEAGLEKALYDLREDFVNDSSPSWSDGDINGYTLSPSTDSYYTIPYDVTSLNGGSYEVQLLNSSSANAIWVESTGTIEGMSQSLRAYVTAVNISPWDNAIFAGAGAAGKLISGNVDIRGSVHLLGNGLAPTDNAVYMGGTAEIVGNNYSGMAAYLEDKIPKLPTITISGEASPSETLSSELRIKRGMIELSGSAAVGQETKNADKNDGEKENVDGTYVTDGYDCGDADNRICSSVYSDNGTTEAYDLGDAVSFPSLGDDAPEDTTKTIKQYFIDEVPSHSNPTGVDLASALSNLQASSNFKYYDDTNNNNIFDANEDGISMDGSGNMYISGRIYVNGAVSIGGSDPITYTGTGTILAEGNVAIKTSLITPAPADPSDPALKTYPENIIGIMTPGDISLGESAQIDIMGLFYAENQVVVNKQTDVIGTLVTNYFDTGGQVPAVYQVPEVVNNLPEGLITSSEVWFLKVVWKEIDAPTP